MRVRHVAALLNSRRARAARRQEIVSSDSVAAASAVPDASVDFVYLDARHDFAGVVADPPPRRRARAQPQVMPRRKDPPPQGECRRSGGELEMSRTL